MLNFTLATAFIFYIAATSRSSSLVFCSKVVLRLALVHSKYTGNREVSVLRIWQRIKSPLLNFLPTAQRSRCFSKMILSNLSCCRIFGKLTGENQWPFLQSLAQKKILLTGVFLRIFQTCFRTAIFIKHFWGAVSVFPSNTQCLKQQLL